VKLSKVRGESKTNGLCRVGLWKTSAWGRIRGMLNQRGRLLFAALGFTGLTPEAGGGAPEITPLRQWLDSWSGIGAVAVGMQRQGYDLQLTGYGDGHWRATFYTTGLAHSISHGSAWGETPWGATQRAAWETLR